MYKKRSEIGKFFAALLLVFSTFIVTWFILDGHTYATNLLNEAIALAKYKPIHTVELSIDVEEPLLAGQTYRVYYTAKNSKGEELEDPGLLFESLDKDILSVASYGYISSSMDFEGEESTAQMRITSKYCKRFSQTVTVRFVKTYPSKFSVRYYVLGLETNAKTLYVGAPVSVSSYVSTAKYNMKDYEVLYDETYFSYDAENDEYMPIRPTPIGEKTTFAIRYGNGATEECTPFTIMQDAPSEFDEVQAGSTVLDGYEGLRNKLGTIKLYKDGKRIYTPYQVDLRDEDGEVNRDGVLSYAGVGEKQMTITLLNGFSKTCTFRLYNIVDVPTIEKMPLNENGALEILQYKTKEYSLEFENKDQTYHSIHADYDSSVVRVQVNRYKVIVYGVGAGSTTVTLYLDDGEQRVEVVFDVEVEADNTLATYIKNNKERVKSKVLGHFGLFFIQGLIVFNFFLHFKVKDKRKLVLLHTTMALPMAIFTEFIQYFTPGRNGRLSDIGIDMLGFYLGTLVAFLIWGIVSAMKNELDYSPHDNIYWDYK